MGEPEPVDEILILLRVSLQRALAGSIDPRSSVIMAGCGHRVWASPEAIEHLARHSGLVSSCDSCTDPATALASGEAKGLVPGTLDALEDWLGVAEGDQLRAMARDLGFQELPDA